MLKKYLLSVGIAVFICLSFGLGFSMLVLRLADAQEASVKEQQQLLLSNIQAPMQAALQTMRLASEFLAISTVSKATVFPNMAYDVANTSFDLQRIMGLFPLVECLIVLDADKKLLLTTYPLPPSFELTSADFVDQALIGRRSLSKPFISPVTGYMALAAASPISHEGVTGGVAVVLINLYKFANATTNRLRVGSTGYAMLVDASGYFMLHPDSSQIGRALYGNALGDQIMARESGYAEGMWDGVKKWVAFSQMPLTDWKLLVTIEYDEYMRPVTALRNTTLFMGGAMVLFIVVGVGWLTLRLIGGLEGARLAAEKSGQAKSNFLANMSHEIRTPMNGIMGLTHLMQKTQLTEQQAMYLHKIVYSSKTLLRLINDILDVSKIEANKLQIELVDCYFSEVQQFVVNALEHSIAEKHLSFDVEINPNVPDVLYTDQFRLGQIILNLAGNAVKFTEKGSIRIKVDAEYSGGALHDATPYAPVKLSVSISDTGIGMSQEAIERLFLPFSQADNSMTRRFGGTGLGLVISRHLVRLLGGEIMVESEPGVGTTFHFDIACQVGDAAKIPENIQFLRSNMPAPVVPEDPESTAHDALPLAGVSTSEGTNKGKVRILLAEDNEINQLVAVELLEGMGAEVLVAGDGVQAVQLAQTESFDCIFMDIQMPGMDGLTATQLIRKFNTTVPIIAMTAHALSTDREKSLEAGMNEHITKPLNVDELDMMLKKYTLQPRAEGIAS